MREKISGIIGIAFGAFILLGSLLRGGPQGEGAYRAGQFVGIVFGLLLVAGGVYYLVRAGGTTVNAGQKAKPGKSKARRRAPRPIE